MWVPSLTEGMISDPYEGDSDGFQRGWRRIEKRRRIRSRADRGGAWRGGRARTSVPGVTIQPTHRDPPTALFLAAGASTRYGRPKQLEPLGPTGETLLDYGIFDAWRAGFRRFVFVINAEVRSALSSHLVRRLLPDGDVRLVAQDPGENGTPLGTAHAVWCAQDVLTSPFAVANADDWYGPQSWRALADALADTMDPAPGSPAEWALVGFPLGSTLTESGGVSRGICSVDETGHLESVREARNVRRASDGVIEGILQSDAGTASSPLPFPENTVVSMNLWGFGPSFLPVLDEGVKDFLARRSGSRAPGEFYLPQAVQDALDRGAGSVRVLPTPERWMGITHPGDAEAVSARLATLHGNGVYPPAGLPPLGPS